MEAIEAIDRSVSLSSHLVWGQLGGQPLTYDRNSHDLRPFLNVLYASSCFFLYNVILMSTNRSCCHELTFEGKTTNILIYNWCTSIFQSTLAACALLPITLWTKVNYWNKGSSLLYLLTTGGSSSIAFQMRSRSL